MPEFVSHPNFIGIVSVAIVGGVIGAIWKFGVWFGSVNSDRAAFNRFMDKIDGTLDDIRNNIDKIFHLLPAPSTHGESPVQLTDFGKDISGTVDAVDWAENHAPELVKEARGKQEFEVFDLCVDRVDKELRLNPEFRKSVRYGAYQHATDEDNVLKVYYVVLRDEVLKLLQK